MTPKNYQTINICWMLIHPQELRKTQVPPSGPQSCHQAAPWGSGRSYAGGRMGKSWRLGISLAARMLHVGVVLGHQEPLGGHQATVFLPDGGTLIHPNG